MHAASAGEAYLAQQILKTINYPEKLKVLVTSNTSQGKEILKNSLETSTHEITVSYAPFDRPSLCRKAVAIADPKLLVLIESEIWPGLMAEIKREGKKIIIINGRMTRKSYYLYNKTRYVWRNLKPDTILAISEDDKNRFSALFGLEKTYYVNNIKFDRMDKCRVSGPKKSSNLFIVLASIRKEEEDQVLFLIKKLLERIPNLQIGLFPRHMHRITAWKKLLTRNRFKWELKSRTQLDDSGSKIILWDVFGELEKVYRKADAAFVGGSLVPLGGQNFIEAFMNGVVPVTGPYIDNFLWAGNEVFSEGLVKIGKTKEEALELLIENLHERMDGSDIKRKVDKYINTKQGGSIETCHYIVELMKKHHEIDA